MEKRTTDIMYDQQPSRLNIQRKIKFYEAKDDETDASTGLELKANTQRRLGDSKRSAASPPTEWEENTVENLNYQSLNYLAHNGHSEKYTANSNTSKSRSSNHTKKSTDNHEESQEDGSSSNDIPLRGPSETRDDNTTFKFKSTQETRRAYQSQSGEKKDPIQFIEPLSPNPDEYHWKIIESRRHLHELQKSLTSEISEQASDGDGKRYMPVSPVMPHEKIRISMRSQVPKQSNDSSVLSNSPTKSTFTEKLISLRESHKTDKTSRRRSQKPKDVSPKTLGSYSKGRFRSQVYPTTENARQKRNTMLTSKYLEESNGERYIAGTGTSLSDDDHLRSLTTALTVQHFHRQKKPTYDSLNEHHSYLPELDKASKQNPQNEHDQSFSRSKTRQRPPGEKGDIADRTYSNEEDVISDGQKLCELMINGERHQENEDMITDVLEKLPSTYSKRLQVRPWNMIGHLSNNATQTTITKMQDAISQTLAKKFITTSAQTDTITSKTTGVQADIHTDTQDSAAQTSYSVRTTSTQTADETSDGVTTSLDTIIRMGAIKRTQSLGVGLSSNMDRPLVRSSTIEYISLAKKEAGQSNDEKKSKDGTDLSGKISSYDWKENDKFIKIFISYSGIHLLPSKNIHVKTNGMNLRLTVEEYIRKAKDKELETVTSTLYLKRLRRPVSCLSYNIQRDMVTIMLRKQKQIPWNTLLFTGANI